MSVDKRIVPARLICAAVCNGCGARGPECDSEDGAIEVVTAERASKETGFVMSDYWSRNGSRLMCWRCREAGATP